MSEEPLARIERQLQELIAGQTDLRGDVTELRGDVTELRAGQVLILKRLDKVEVVQEAIADDVKGLAEGQAALRIAMRQGIDGLREDIGRRLDPLEAAVRSLHR